MVELFPTQRNRESVKNAKKNEIVQKTMNHKSGYQRVVNTEGKYFFASFEYIPVLDWGIVAELPVEEIYRPYEMFEKTLWIVSGVTILLLFYCVICKANYESYS